VKRLDAHAHLWNLDDGGYPALQGADPIFRRNFEPADLRTQMDPAGIGEAILVQADDATADTEAMLANAAVNDWIVGVVGWVPLATPAEAERMLEVYALNPLFRGVRHLIHEEPDPDWVLQNEVIESLRLVAAMGLTFDIVAVLPRHLEHAATLARAVPELRMVIDHLAKPPIRDAGWEPWHSLLKNAAEHPNVLAKMSGLNTAADPKLWSAADLQPYVDTAIEMFGPDRLMFGSDWPISLLAGGYPKVVAETLKTLAPYSVDEVGAIMGGTARAFYRT
jgi:L-fuconolactonase